MGVSSSDREQTLRVAMVVADERDAHGKYGLPEPYFGPAPAALLDGFRRLKEVEIHVVSCVRRPVVAPAKLATNVYFHAIPVPSWGYLKTFYLPTILEIRRALKRIQPHVVHGQGTERYYALAAAFSGFPSVVTIHGNMRAVARSLQAAPFTFHWWTARLETLAVRRAGGVVCLSSYTRQQVEDLARKTWILHNAVPDAYFEVERSPSNEPRLLCVGMICPYKNQNALIRALDRVASEHRFQMVFAGPLMPGSYSQEFLELVSARSWCEHAGVLDNARLRSELALARALVHPSLEDNCPMVILEAMAAGLPVIGSRCGGIPDLVEPERTGLLCDTDEMHSFAEAIRTILQNAKLSEEFGLNGRVRANREFRSVDVAAQHVPVYREVMEYRTQRNAEIS